MARRRHARGAGGGRPGRRPARRLPLPGGRPARLAHREWLHSGIADLVPDGDDLRRVPATDYIARLNKWQRRLNRVTALDADPFDNPVDLRDVQRAVKEPHELPR